MTVSSNDTHEQDLGWWALRALVIDPDETDMGYLFSEWGVNEENRRVVESARAYARVLLSPAFDVGDEMVRRQKLTEVALEMSLCPLHLVDYAICFDDQNPECAAIRTIHPGHDT